MKDVRCFLIFVLDHHRRVRLRRPSDAIQPSCCRVGSTRQLIFESFRVLRVCTTPACLRPWDTLAGTWLLEILDRLHETGATSDTLILLITLKLPNALSPIKKISYVDRVSTDLPDAGSTRTVLAPTTALVALVASHLCTPSNGFTS